MECYNYKRFQDVFHNNYLRSLIFQFLHSKDGKRYDEIQSVFWITSNGYFNLLKYKLIRDEKLRDWSPTSMMDICEHGDLELLKMVDEQIPGLYYTEECMNEAASNGHFEIVKWLHKNRTEGCTESAMDTAASTGQFEIVKWLHENRTEGCTNLAIDFAVKNGHFEIVKYLYENRSEGASFFALDVCGLSKNMEMVRYVAEVINPGCSLAINSYLGDANNVEVFNYLYVEKKLFRTITIGLFINAAKSGGVEIIDRVLSDKDINFNLDEVTIIQKRILGACAGIRGHNNVLDIFHKYGLLDISINYLDIISGLGKLESMKWFYENGYRVMSTKAMNEVKDIEKIKFLHGINAQCTKTCADINYSNLEIIKFLLENRKEGCSKQCYLLACESGHLDVVKYISSKYPSAISIHGLYSSCYANHIDIFKYLETIIPKETLFPLDILKATLSILSKKGHLDLLKYFLSQYRNHKSMINLFKTQPTLLQILGLYALDAKHLETYEFIRGQIDQNNLLSDILYQISKENVEEISSLLSKKSLKAREKAQLFSYACEINNIEIMKLLLKNFDFFSIDWLLMGEIENPIIVALENGYFDMVKLFFNKHSKDEDIVKDVFYRSCEMGNIGMIDFLAKLRCGALSNQRCLAVASNHCFERGQISVYKYLQKHCYYCSIAPIDVEQLSEFNSYTLTKHICKEGSLPTLAKKSILESIKYSRKTLISYLMKFGLELPKPSKTHLNSLFLYLLQGGEIDQNSSDSMEAYYNIQELALDKYNQPINYTKDPYLLKNSKEDTLGADNIDTDNSDLGEDGSDDYEEDDYLDEDEEDEELEEEDEEYTDDYFDEEEEYDDYFDEDDLGDGDGIKTLKLPKVAQSTQVPVRPFNFSNSSKPLYSNSSDPYNLKGFVPQNVPLFPKTLPPLLSPEKLGPADGLSSLYNNFIPQRNQPPPQQQIKPKFEAQPFAFTNKFNFGFDVNDYNQGKVENLYDDEMDLDYYEDESEDEESQ